MVKNIKIFCYERKLVEVYKVIISKKNLSSRDPDKNLLYNTIKIKGTLKRDMILAMSVDFT